MIPAAQVIEIITEQFPDISFDVNNTTTLFQKFEHLADHATALLDNDELERAQQLFILLEELTPHVEPITLIAIENVFIYRLGTHIECDKQRKQLLVLLPGHFKEIMVAQLTAPGI